MQKFHLLVVVFLLEAVLRIISHLTTDATGHSKYPLLAPIYFIMITPIFYLGVWLFGKGLSDEYFFPSIDDDSDVTSGFLGQEGIWDIFHVVNLSTVSWAAVMRSIPTMIALVMFSLIHVPINIPAFAVSSDVDIDMNAELIAHGYSNGIVGMLGGMSMT